MKLGILTAPFADTALTDVADWAGSVGFEALEIACWPRSTGTSRRYAGTTHIDAGNTSASEAKGIVGGACRQRPRRLGARLLSKPAASRCRPSQDRHRSSEEGHRDGQPRGGGPRQHFLRRRRVQDGRHELAGRAPGLAGDHRLCPRSWRQARLRELPDDLQHRRVAWRAQHRLLAACLAAYPGSLGRRCRHEFRSVASRLADDRPGAFHPGVRARTCCTRMPRT